MPVVVLDTETTGHMGESRASVIEVGAVCLAEDGDELGVFCSLVKPLHPLGFWSQEALAVSGIPADRLLSAPEAGAVWEALLRWMGLHKPVRQVLAFNVPFDQRMMQRTFPGAEHLPWGPCLMRGASEVIRGNRSSIKLTDAAAAFGFQPVTKPHRAMADARLAAFIWAQTQARKGAA